ENAIRFDEMFEELILPLKENRTHSLTADFTEETAVEYRKHDYRFENIDVVLLEGIYLFKPAYRNSFDLALWIECTFETALDRALLRNQEALSPDETVRAYETIYFPAQQIHFEKDVPKETVDLIIVNDPRIEPG